ncbi:MAG: hypothetical protein SGPRY_003074, partial [Prymnesium sp.]
VRSHAFFKKIDFIKLLRREVPMPFVPKIAHPADTSYFEECEPEDLQEAYPTMVNPPPLAAVDTI